MSSWQRQGICGVHNGPGYNLNKAYPSGLIAAFYGLKKETWVCQMCWDHARVGFLNKEIQSYASKVSKSEA